MIKISDIYEFIDEFAPFSSQMDFDNSGLLIGNMDSPIKKVLIALDITSEVINECLDLKASLIVSHHPVIFKPIKSIDSNSIPYLLCKNNLSAICAHTNLDLSNIGINFCLFEKLNLNNKKPLSIVNDFSLGYIGYLDGEMTSYNFAKFIQKNLECKNLRFTDLNNKIKKVAVCSGSGGSFINDVIKNKCDAFVTGEIKHSDILLANENNLSIFDVGHFKSENVVIPSLKSILQDKFEMIEFFESNCCGDHINYL